MTHTEWKSIDSVCSISMLQTPLTLSRNGAMRMVGESGVLHVSDSAVLELQKTEDGPKETPDTGLRACPTHPLS